MGFELDSAGGDYRADPAYHQLRAQLIAARVITKPAPDDQPARPARRRHRKRNRK